MHGAAHPRRRIPGRGGARDRRAPAYLAGRLPRRWSGCARWRCSTRGGGGHRRVRRARPRRDASPARRSWPNVLPLGTFGALLSAGPCRCSARPSASRSRPAVVVLLAGFFDQAAEIRDRRASGDTVSADRAARPAYLVAGWLLLLGAYGIVPAAISCTRWSACRSPQSATYVLLLAVGYRRRHGAGVLRHRRRRRTVVDPVVQALTLTDVVVGATVTALLLALGIQVAKRHGTVDPDEAPGAARLMPSTSLPLPSRSPCHRRLPAARRRPAPAPRIADRRAARSPRRPPSLAAAAGRPSPATWSTGRAAGARRRVDRRRHRAGRRPARCRPGRAVAAGLTVAALVFGWRYFDEVGTPTIPR